MKCRKCFLFALILIVLFSGCIESKTNAGNKTLNLTQKEKKEAEPEVKEFSITAKQWSFEPSTIEVKKGDKVRLLIKSIDVEHGFALPEFNVNENLSPGKEIKVEFTANKTGTFTFYCNVYCGSGHKDMKGTLVVK
jgi:cytochrome c oxidase subunit 2